MTMAIPPIIVFGLLYTRVLQQEQHLQEVISYVLFLLQRGLSEKLLSWLMKAFREVGRARLVGTIGVVSLETKDEGYFRLEFQ